MTPLEASKTGFVRALFAGGGLSVVRLITGFIRNKYIATALGASGVGVLAQGSQVSVLSGTVASCAMSTGLIQLLNTSRALEDPDFRRRILSTAFTAQALLASVIMLVGAVFSVPTSKFLFGDDGLPVWVLALACGTPVVTLASGYLEAVLFAGQRFDLYVKASAAAAVAALVLTLAFVAWRGVAGGFWALSASGAVLFLLFVVAAGKIGPLQDYFRIGFDSSVARSLLKMSIVLFGTGVMIYGSSICLRRIVMDRFGSHAAGIVQVPIALTAYFTPFLTNALWGHLHPKVAASGDGPDSRRELRAALGWNALLYAAIVPAVLALSKPIILLAYSTEFLLAEPLLSIQFLGDAFYFQWFAVSVYFLAIGRLRWYFIGWFVFYAVTITASLCLAPFLGLPAFPAAYALASLLCGFLAGLWMGRSAGFGLRDLSFVFGLPAVCWGIQTIVCNSTDSAIARLVVPMMAGLFLLRGFDGRGLLSSMRTVGEPG